MKSKKRTTKKVVKVTPPTKKALKKSRGKLMKDAWKLMSIFVRKSEADWRGYVSCITCGKQYIWNSGQIHAGHWLHDKLDFDPRNVHPQCADCNYKFNWKKATGNYALYMAKTYGHEIMQQILLEANTKGNAYSIEELEIIIEDLKEKIKCLKTS